MEIRVEERTGHDHRATLGAEWVALLSQAHDQLQAAQRGETVKENLDSAASALHRLEKAADSWIEVAYDCPRAGKTRGEVRVLHGSIKEARQDVALSAEIAEDDARQGSRTARRVLRTLPKPQAVVILAPGLVPSERHHRQYHFPAAMSCQRCRFCGYVVV